MSTTTSQRAMEDCWENPERRDCYRCEAHSSREGLCCFGQWEYGHPKCGECEHEIVCNRETVGREEEEEASMDRPRRVQVNRVTGGSRLPIYGQRDRENLLASSVPRSTVAHKDENLPALPVSDRMKTFFQGMGKRGVWGAGEGALEMMLGYMRSMRPW